MNPNYPVVAERAGHRCEYCHAPEAVFNIPFEVEHITPLTKDGSDEASNWALACRSCNLNKSNHTDGFDPVTQKRVRLFHPRQDNKINGQNILQLMKFLYSTFKDAPLLAEQPLRYYA